MNPSTPSTPPARIEQIDMLRCVLILLVVAFHLAYIGQTYPEAKRWVYTFHMPGFLLISGYLFGKDKPCSRFLTSLLWMAVPYVVMETGYTLMASLLPIRDHVDHLTPALLMRHLALSPLGPYWYLHTLLICQMVAYAVFHLPRISRATRYLLSALACYALAEGFRLVALPHAFYFLAGMVIAEGLPRRHVSALGSWAALPALVVLSLDATHYDRATLPGIGIALAACSLLLWLAAYPSGLLRRLMLLIGRNTMPIYLFSPIFTILAKAYLPLTLSIDGTGMLFLIVSAALAVAGSLGLSRLMDRMGLSRYFFGKAVQLS